MNLCDLGVQPFMKTAERDAAPKIERVCVQEYEQTNVEQEDADCDVDRYPQKLLKHMPCAQYFVNREYRAQYCDEVENEVS